MANTNVAAADLQSRIFVAEKELVMREAAAKHLNGLPKRHNQNAIDGLYDVLTDLHIQAIEARQS